MELGAQMTPFFICLEGSFKMNELRIWISGAAGSIGKNLVAYFEKHGYTVLPSDQEVDVRNVDTLIQYAESNRPDIIINAAAMTGFEACEQDSLQAYKVNALGARNMAAAAQRVHAKLIHISSDDVFVGTNKTLLNEFEQPQPTTVYGKSKLAGEQMIRELYSRHIIIRSSWIYDFSEHNFLRNIFDQVNAKQTVDVCGTQFSSPTSIDAFMRLLHKLMVSNEYGLFHASCEGVCSRYEFAKEALRLANMDVSLVCETSANTYGQSGHIILDNLMLKMTELDTMPAWEVELKNFMKAQGGILND